MNLEFEGGFSKIHDGNTFNKKDKLGLIFLVNVLFVIILFIVVYILRKKNYGLTLTTVFLLLILGNIYYYSRTYNKIHILYAFSYLISANTRTDEFLNVDEYFQNHIKFESNFSSFRTEVMTFLEKEGVKNIPFTRDSFGGENDYIGSDVKINESGEESGWRLITLKVGNEITSKCLEHFPVIAQTLSDCPEVVSCALSILEPGVMIPIHIGYYKGIMRYMLPLSVPDDKENCFLWVNGIKYSWTDGKSVLWDDTYPHKVYNDTNQLRVLLYMDVVRPIDGLLGKINLLVLKLIQNSQIVRDEIKRTEQKISIR